MNLGAIRERLSLKSDQAYTLLVEAASKSERQQKTMELIDAIEREKERLRATLTPEEYEHWRQGHIEEFDRLCRLASEQAKANGLTEEILAEILAEE
jgi:hypothetical protein